MERESNSSEYELRIREIISRDNQDDFISCLESSSVIKSRRVLKFRQCELSVQKLLGWICSQDAVGCAATLLVWSENKGMRVSLNVPNENGVLPLHEAANSLSSGLTRLFLDHGAKPDVKCKAKDSLDYGLRPLEIALRRASSDENLNQWTPKQSPLTLINMLCLPKMRKALETVMSLASSTKEREVNLAFHLCATEGKPIQLAILLMVAGEKVIMTNMPSEGGWGFTVCWTFRQSLCCELAKLIDEEFSLIGKIESNELSRTLEERKESVTCALKLVEIFERAVDDFKRYFQLDRPEALWYVTQKISSTRRELGVVCDGKYINFKALVERCTDEPIIHSDDSDEESDYRFEHGSQEFYKKMQPLRGMPYEYGGFTGTRFLHGSSISSFTLRPFLASRFSKGNNRSWFHGTAECQVKERSGVDYSVRNFLPRKRLALLTLAVKRGIRFA